MAASSFPLDIAQLVALYMQCIVYGIVLITVAYGLRVLLWSRDGHFKSRTQISWVMVGTTVAMFTIATLEMAFGLQHNLQAFIYYKGPGGAIAEFSDISNWVNVMRTADYVAQMFIGDGIMVYRCYVVYEKNWKVVVVPVLLWLAETACGWVIVYIDATLHTSATLNISQLEPFITTVLSLTLAMTTMTTGLIVYRIMKINHSIASQDITRVGGSRRLTHVVRILIESGLIYTASVVVFFGTYLASNNAQYGVSDLVVQLIPISFTLILIRVDQGIAVETYTLQQSTLQFSVRPGVADAPHGAPVSRSNLSSGRSDSYVMDEMGEIGDRVEWKKAGQLDPVV
ncbi:hypothetical protein L226DRAFT_557681 [Lentinus tigrinus ALCF2SS1-7]|uniref:Uncharacterized protein n=1 Tax=Lentinus tigrinus ALCF2SS1-6 TaxID=1328759 RepID=A0A5C2SRL2_9APHY|nr:hypothetical protein L227DRAFT_518806 [Lentinus tigrinus ALCF2SS1-6]RPD78878.1 hypothetical protein L226DRAFT_557681 [Lentinus tigrinus ALCF2SS1-7]